MKTVRAYGGKVLLWNVREGWAYEVFGHRTIRPPRRAQNGYYVAAIGVHESGTSASMREARRRGVNALKAIQ